ncbi:MAG: pentapeptide repeat-containing protein [Acetobacteraceae bacterium]|nr:pentapeptide repeat-containing protein [Acetobacteraceae bacterium]
MSTRHTSTRRFSISADLSEANLRGANLRGADLSGAILRFANLVETDLRDADLTGCHIYGISAWGLKLSEKTEQRNLVITTKGEPEITLDNIEVAQFVYLLLHNEKIGQVIDTITSKVVLILGRFTPERKKVLDALRNELRNCNYLPVVFDFEKPVGQTTDETITLLARMARFVIADITDAKSVLQELRGIVPALPSVAVQPLILVPQEEPGMFDFFRKYPWVIQAHRYDSEQQLMTDLEERVIRQAEAKVLELRGPQPG